MDEAKTNKENLISKKDGVSFDYKKTEEYVNRIKKLKGNYCREYELYEKLAKSIKLKVVQYREEVNHSIKMQNLYSEEINKLRNLEVAFENLRMKILDRMKWNDRYFTSWIWINQYLYINQTFLNFYFFCFWSFWSYLAF